MQRLHHVDVGSGGISRKPAGRGFHYVSSNGRQIVSATKLDRIAELAIPPAWIDVWISSDPLAHIQATGIDAAGRTQYIYHARWRELRDEEKFIRSLAFAQRLPTIRRMVTRALKNDADPLTQALAASVRLIDRAGLRVGGATYAQQNGSFGATTLQHRHVKTSGDNVRLVFRGKSEGHWDVQLHDPLLAIYFAHQPSHPLNGPAFGCPVSDTQVNNYLAALAGHGFSAKDFRTWQGTVVAAVSLAKAHRRGDSSTQAITAAMGDAAAWLHNTPAIAQKSYVNPRVVSLFDQGKVAQPHRSIDAAVRALLS